MDWINLVKSVAPVLGTALGGPLGGMAVKAIGDALNMPLQNVDALKSVLSASPMPEQLAAIKNADQDFAFKMSQLGFEHKEAIAKLNAQAQGAEVQDRDSARKMQVSLHSRIVPIMAILTTIGFFGLLFFMFFCPVPPENKDVLNHVVGSLGAAWTMIIAFYFGTSFGSQNKDTLLARVRQGSR